MLSDYNGIKRLPGWLSGKEPPVNVGDVGLMPGSGKSLGEGMATHFSILAWKNHAQRSLAGYSL